MVKEDIEATSSPSSCFHSTRRRPPAPRGFGAARPPTHPSPMGLPTPPRPGPGLRHPSGPFLSSVTFPKLRWAVISLASAFSSSRHFLGDIEPLLGSMRTVENVASARLPTPSFSSESSCLPEIAHPWQLQNTAHAPESPHLLGLPPVFRSRSVLPALRSPDTVRPLFLP